MAYDFDPAGIGSGPAGPRAALQARKRGKEAGVVERRAANILLAVGTKPAPPPGVAVDREVVATSDDVVCLKRLPRSVIVVGGGVIGIEYASMLAALGMTVTVVDQRERVLEFLDREIVDELVHQMHARNVTFRLGEAVSRLEIAEGPPRRAVTLLESGKRIVADT